MRLSRDDADIFIPDRQPLAAALARVTHLCVSAHQDDIEIMAHAGIAECVESKGKKAFGGVVVTNGAGSPRAGKYATFTDDEMPRIRRDEQRRAAELGRYAVQIQLAHPSAHVKSGDCPEVLEDLTTIFGACSPTVVYLHNPADKHDTHVAVLLRCIEALRAIPPGRRPQRVLGCEVWRDLDWLIDADKVALDAGRQPRLAARLLGAFESQIIGKRYDLATIGRRRAHATFSASHSTDKLKGITWAMDLTPLMRDSELDVAEYTLAYVDRLRDEIATRIRRYD